MNVEILEQLSQKDSDDLFRWREQVFPIEGKGIEWSKLSRHVVCRNDEGMAVGHIGFGEFAIISANKEIAVIGVGGVVIRPEYQGKGIPAGMFEMLHRELSGPGNPKLFTLFCPKRLEGYYVRHGYKVYEGTVKVIQKKELVPVDLSFMFRGSFDFGPYINLTSEPW